MKKNNSVTLGFTLIEVLISIVILSIITIITSTFLQSSINSKNLVFNKSADILQINLFGDRLKQDLVNAVNVPLLDQRGEIMEATFQGDINSKIFSFVTRATSNTLSSKLLVKVQYYLKDNELIRRQFFAASPSSSEDYYETVLFTGVKDIELEFSNDGIDAIANIASEVNTTVENIGARRLHTIIEKVLDDISFNATDKSGEKIVIDEAYVKNNLGDLVKDTDLSKFIL